MFKIIPVVRQKRRFVRDEAGTAQIEWLVAVALVVMTAIPVIVLVGKGSEQYSDDIAISITETSASLANDSRRRTIVAGVDVDELGEPPVDTAPGAELGIGYADNSDLYEAYRLLRDPERLRKPVTVFHGAKLSEIRRDKPAEDTVRRANDVSSLRPGPSTVAFEGSGISLPRLPESDTGFTDAACRDMVPIDEEAISQAKFVTAEVVTSGR